MSLSTLLGVLFGFGLFLGSIMHFTDDYLSFWDTHALVLVLGGTIAAAYMSYQARYVNRAFHAIGYILQKPRSTREGLNMEIMRLIKWGYVVQTKGLQGLEQELKKTKLDDPLLQYMLDAVAGGHKPEDLRPMLETAIESEFERITVPVQVLKMMAATGPNFGMIGTLIGMVIMLQNVGDDMAQMAKGLSVALLATLYGVVVARMVFLPAANKLMQKEEIQRFRNYLMLEGLVMLAEKRSPRYMQDRLNSFLDPSIHFDIDVQLRKP